MAYLFHQIKLMKMEAINLCSLRDITFDPSISSLNFGGFDLFQSGKFLDKNHFTPEWVKEVGDSSTRQFLNPYLFRKTEYTDEKDLILDTLKFKSRLNHLINYLWFSKDCAANIGGTYSYIIEKKLTYQIIAVAGFSNAKGEFVNNAIFSNRDFELSEKVYDKVVHLQTKIDFKHTVEIAPQKVYDSPYHYTNQAKTNSIDRAFTFLMMARSNSFLPLKISLHVAILECLFTIDSSEVIHKVSERVAFYIGGELENKIEIFKRVKEAYSVRSKFFHGQAIKGGSIEKMQEISVSIDDIVRVVLHKVIFEDSELFLSSQQELQKHFNKQLFV